MIPLPYKLLAIGAALVGVFIFGYMKGSAYAEAELARFSAQKSEQVAELERKNSAISTQVVTKYVDRVNTIREKEYVYRDIVKDSVPTLSTICLMAGCTRTTLVPHPVMPTPPELLMRAPQELQTLQPSLPSSETIRNAKPTPNSSVNSSNGLS